LKMEFVAAQPLAAREAGSFAMLLRRTLAPLTRAPKKVLALDLDNTLWGGVLGEDGYANLRTGREFPGNIYWSIQRAALSLKERGVILVLLSKNNLADVEEAFRMRARDLLMSLADFSAVRINWSRKADNLREAAKELNLGVDSFVFVDDQPFERAEMSFHLPEVTILDAGEDPLTILQAIAQCSLFDSKHITSEDLARSADYAAQQQRKAAAEQAGASGEFFQSLNLQARITPLSATSVGRALQMLERTNQFNLTTRRHSLADLQRMMAIEGSILLCLSLSDRFGDQGIVGLAIALPQPSSSSKACLAIDSFLLSCRALGRGAEAALFVSLARRAASRGYSMLRATFVPTEKNLPCKDFFEAMQMQVEASGAEPGKHYLMQLSTTLEFPRWISVIEE
jgi:FkbH-like protein